MKAWFYFILFYHQLGHDRLAVRAMKEENGRKLDLRSGTERGEVTRGVWHADAVQ